jgi:predicted RecA/RadA family phage recombinase
MAQNYVQEGAVMPWTNGTGGDISSGDVVLVGTRVGVALGDIADGDDGQVAIEGVFEVAKAAPLVISQGDLLYWDAADENFNKTDTDNTLAGFAFADAASADTTVLIKLNA